ncbi:MAG: plasminogen-binding N-terminal domain-containing protein [Arcobacter sp.]|jgi:hypothetical protein|uniref:Plasminogen-binding protein PgbA N-terminal domain-containing protein n=1 Tax=Arcobacter defluvii TaxID=873191 RepID=A0AAE7E6Z6_9BACT|nr:MULTISPECIES: plasminogen-binding N-terminal domain-containing protein [Arcobacter]MDY3201111.1 plasminogen-binding N-terminal domain-containing protein [Arcobacter sp.]QKF78440.1 hypothetical protein ADFLV_2452 [Arcobacter defluvii]RXI30777.1 hypothetical protein CP964_11020 [Arcobacter defluvii]
MGKIFNKVLLLGAVSLISCNLMAEETICFKNGVDKPSTIEDTALEGDICKGKLTVNDMKSNGWDVLDIKITSSQNKFNYSYYFYKENHSSAKPVSTTSNATLQTNVTADFSIKPIGSKITNLQDNKSTINIGNLIVGQTGIVVHIYDNDKRQIISNAKVISSNANSSVVEFFPFDDLLQEALPTSNRQVSINDVLVLNYMYNSSLLIAPSLDSFQAVRSNFKSNNFIHSDIFAAKLKVENKPFPTKEDIQNFAISQNLGTIFFVLDNKVFIVDTKTFTILATYAFAYENGEKQMPFYTRVEEIEGSIFDFSFFSSNESLTYDEYYEKVLGLK